MHCFFTIFFFPQVLEKILRNIIYLLLILPNNFFLSCLLACMCCTGYVSMQALVEGPDTGVERQLIPFKRLALTDYKLPIQRNARIGTIRAAAKVILVPSLFIARR